MREHCHKLIFTTVGADELFKLRRRRKSMWLTVSIPDEEVTSVNPPHVESIGACETGLSFVGARP